MKRKVKDFMNKNRLGFLKAVAAFFIIMLFFTFFSKTINNFSLPKVRVTRLQSGSFTYQIQAEGTMEAADRTSVYLDLSVSGTVKVAELNVNLASHVENGDVLLTYANSAGEIFEVKSPCAGTVTEVNIAQGNNIDSSTKLIVIDSFENGYVFKGKIRSADSDVVRLNTQADVIYSAGDPIRGTVIDTHPSYDSPGYDEITMALDTQAIRLGQTGAYTLEASSAAYPYIIDTSALVQSSTETALYILEERNGSRGNGYYVKKVLVNPLESNYLKTALEESSELMNYEKGNVMIINGSDRPVKEGDKVLLQ